MQIEEPFPEPMLLATTVELVDGLVARGIPGQGRLAHVPDPARYDATHAHADLLVVGAGPAGLAAALTAARAGRAGRARRRAVRAGRRAARQHRPPRRRPGLDWVAAATAELANAPTCCTCSAPPRSATTTTDSCWPWSGGPTTSVPRAPRHRSRQRVWRIRARHVLVATGAHERPVVFADNDRPGIMLAGCGADLLHRYGVLAGRDAVVFTTDDGAYAAALDLADAGVRVHAVVDARPSAPAGPAAACAERGIPVRPARS